MSDEKLVHHMGEARLIAASENVIYPLIELKIKNRIEYACGKFRNGETDFVSDIAFIAALDEIASDLKTKQLQGNKAIQKMHEEVEKNKKTKE